MAGFYLTVGVKQRKCHLCLEKIPKESVHLVVRFPAQFRRQSRINICSNCLNMERLLNLPKLRQESTIKEVLAEHRVGARGKIDALLGVGDEGEPLYTHRKKKVLWQHDMETYYG